MSEQYFSSDEIASQEKHELRIAVFSLSKRALDGSFTLPQLLSSDSSPALFQHVKPLNEAGFVGIAHEDRAIRLFRGSRFVHAGIPALKMVGLLGSVLVTDTDATSHTVTGVAVQTAEPYDFRNFAFRPYDPLELEAHAAAEVANPGSTTLDTIDAQFIGEAIRLIRSSEHVQHRQ